MMLEKINQKPKAYHNVFKYDEEYLLLDKFSIIEKSRICENYNWHQCYSIESISAELRENGSELIEYFANVAEINTRKARLR